MTKKLHELSRFLDKITKSDSDYFLAKAMDQIYLCFQGNEAKFTEFLDPSRRLYARANLSKLSQFGISIAENGGYPEAERMMLGFYPKDAEATPFPIAKISVEYQAKHASLTHGDFLGAILGLGLDRSIIGDIVMLPSSAVIMTEARIGDFLLGNLHKVGKTSVSTALLPEDAHFFGMDNRVPDRLICASLRVDSVLAAAFKLSRGDAAALVKSGKAFVNWQEVNSPAKAVKESDMLTLRKYGRVQIAEVVGKSKKDHFLIDIIRF
ncbi:MAG: YlmH/Sll1252 family protein [Defluviitaleaceae bacterium]|nr:YlmH/Sll1252 family protein [Defluviitaleaceae bacterium]